MINQISRFCRTAVWGEKKALTNSNVAILAVENVKIKQAIKNATVKILHSPLFHLTTIAFFFSEDDLYCISGVDAHCLKSMSNPSANSPTIKKKRKERKQNRTVPAAHKSLYSTHSQYITQSYRFQCDNVKMKNNKKIIRF